jgi:IstB-like ATP binding protein
MKCEIKIGSRRTEEWTLTSAWSRRMPARPPRPRPETRRSRCASKNRSPANDLLIVDELGLVSLSKTGAELLFEMLSQRYERGSTMLTSNLAFAEWTEVLGSERLTGALLDRKRTPNS